MIKSGQFLFENDWKVYFFFNHCTYNDILTPSAFKDCFPATTAIINRSKLKLNTNNYKLYVHYIKTVRGCWYLPGPSGKSDPDTESGPVLSTSTNSVVLMYSVFVTVFIITWFITQIWMNIEIIYVYGLITGINNGILFDVRWTVPASSPGYIFFYGWFTLSMC